IARVRHRHRRCGRGPRERAAIDVLALRAIPRLADIVAGVPALLHDRAADVTWEAGALHPPHALAPVQSEAGPPWAAVTVEAHEPARDVDDLAQLRVVEVGHQGPG